MLGTPALGHIAAGGMNAARGQGQKGTAEKPFGSKECMPVWRQVPSAPKVLPGAWFIPRAHSTASCLTSITIDWCLAYIGNYPD